MSNLKLAPILINNLMDKLTNEEIDLVKSISRGGFLRTKAPTIIYKYKDAGKTLKFKIPEEKSAAVAYLWARVAYWLSPYKKDHAGLRPANLANKDRLDYIADMIVQGTPKEFHYGPISRGE